MGINIVETSQSKKKNKKCKEDLNIVIYYNYKKKCHYKNTYPNPPKN